MYILRFTLTTTLALTLSLNIINKYMYDALDIVFLQHVVLRAVCLGEYIFIYIIYIIQYEIPVYDVHKKKTYHSKIHKKVCIYYIKYNIGLYNDIFDVYYDLWNSIQAASNKILLYVFWGVLLGNYNILSLKA